VEVKGDGVGMSVGSTLEDRRNETNQRVKKRRYGLVLRTNFIRYFSFRSSRKELGPRCPGGLPWSFDLTAQYQRGKKEGGCPGSTAEPEKRRNCCATLNDARATGKDSREVGGSCLKRNFRKKNLQGKTELSEVGAWYAIVPGCIREKAQKKKRV